MKVFSFPSKTKDYDFMLGILSATTHRLCYVQYSRYQVDISTFYICLVYGILTWLLLNMPLSIETEIPHYCTMSPHIIYNFLVTFTSSQTEIRLKFVFSMNKCWMYLTFMHTNIVLFYVRYEITNVHKTISQVNMILFE